MSPSRPIFLGSRRGAQHFTNHPRSQAGFTLMEILVVLAIIGLLVGLTVTKFTNILEGNEKKIAGMFVKSSLSGPLMQYRMALGEYPSTAEGIAALVTAPANKGERWAGPYIEAKDGKVPLDPWGEPYQYRYPGTKNKGSYDLWSKGQDKADGTDDDIGNW
ncbi:MAG: type II secretion system major pseudopilin GspG [Opitutaceae bacterium]|nr:type II secretion system major pseudopilin GspG [Opitutaceae bacterium]